MSYLGQGLGLGREERFTATATAGQTTVSVGDDGRSISYTPNYVDVYLNGSKQVNGSDVTVSSGTSIVFASALTAGDVVDVVAPGYFQPADTVSRSLGGTFSGPVNFPSGGLNVGSGQLQVDSSGRVKMSNQPCFAAAGNQSAAQGSGQVAPFNVATLNVGGNYSTSTYRFTAPVAGVYFFSLYGIIGGNASGQGIVHIRKNGSIVASMHRNSATTNSWEEGACMLHISLAANDYVDTYIGDGNLYLDNGNYYSGFSGRLVG